MKKTNKQPAAKSSRKTLPVKSRPGLPVLSQLFFGLQRLLQSFSAAIPTPMFGRLYALGALLVLIGSTLYWSVLGARLQSANADQLVNPYLLQKPGSLHDALLPGSHSFLLKWPLFLLVKATGASSHSFVLVTVVCVLITVVLFAFLLFKIDRRPLIFGTLCLALASCLLLVPTVAYPGALLPVNMAMLATRNMEYIVFIACLAIITKGKRIRSLSFWMGVALLSLLVASDKLFIYLSLGGAVLALMLYGLSSGWNLVSTSARWIAGSIAGGLGATGILWLINVQKVAHIQTQTAVGPYGLVHNLHELVLGIIYGGLHILTNFGANPASQTLLLNSVVRDGWHHLVSLSGPAYLLNCAVFLFGLYAAWQIIGHSLAHNKDKNVWLNHPSKLSISLVWTSLAAFGIFATTSHYYAADARYVTISLFALFVVMATFISKREWNPRTVAKVGGLLVGGILLSLPGVLHMYHLDGAALAPIDARNIRIAAALDQHKVQVLVGDYWRVLPIKMATGGKLPVLPMQNCTVPRDTLSSRQWQIDLRKNSFAYLLSYDKSLTDFPQCNLDQVIASYGRPNGSVVISGSLAHPTELVLFYDNGAGKSAPINKLRVASTVLPAELDDLPSTICKGPTIMNIVAHEDDDLLFMNPDLSNDISQGKCIRTVYVTAGDAGSSSFYWLGREQGSQAAYGKMLGYDGIWVQRVVHVGGDHYATISNPRGNTKISLIYLRLPDGNLHGQGFAEHHNESLASLDAGKISTIHDVYSGSAYSGAQLQSTIKDLMLIYQPTEIHTQANYISGAFPDHSDHMAVSRIAQRAYHSYVDEHFAGSASIPIKLYLGYPIHAMPVNVSGAALDNKEQVFSIYGKFDPGVCHSLAICRRDSAYGAYLPREYQSPN